MRIRKCGIIKKESMRISRLIRFFSDSEREKIILQMMAVVMHSSKETYEH